jgi:hypothetical protein
MSCCNSRFQSGPDGEERRSSKKISQVEARSGLVGGGLVADDGFGYGRLVDPREDLVQRASLHVHTHRDKKYFPSASLSPYTQEALLRDEVPPASHSHVSREHESERQGGGGKRGVGGGIARDAAAQMLGGMSLNFGHGHSSHEDERRMRDTEERRGNVGGQENLGVGVPLHGVGGGGEGGGADSLERLRQIRNGDGGVRRGAGEGGGRGGAGGGKWSDIEAKQHTLERLRKEQVCVRVCVGGGVLECVCACVIERCWHTNPCGRWQVNFAGVSLTSMC